MTKMTRAEASDIIAKVAAAYAGRSDVSISDILELVSRLSAELDFAPADLPGARSVPQGIPAAAAPETAPKPAMPLAQAVTEDKVYCLCCGKGFKMLKRHLGAEHGLSEDEYRSLFDLPADMPLVAPSYSERKAAYARRVGLGKYSREEASA